MRTSPSGQHVSSRLSQPYLQHATGDGATTTFYLDHEPTSPQGVLVFVSGLAKRPSLNGTANDYSLSGTALTFTVAPGAAAPILFFTLSV